MGLWLTKISSKILFFNVLFTQDNLIDCNFNLLFFHVL
nr:MAG TPA: hypothetical protein [Caudoviricetes sp.]